MKIDRCKQCGANLAMVGIRHRCIPATEATNAETASEPKPKTTARRVSRANQAQPQPQMDAGQNISASARAESIHAASAVTDPVAKATKGKAGTAEVTDLVRRSTAGTGLRVGEAVAVLPATSEIMDATGGESATPKFDRNAYQREYMRGYRHSARFPRSANGLRNLKKHYGKRRRRSPHRCTSRSNGN